jgi:integrase/recombinase XerD
MATAASKAAGIKNLKDAWKGPKDSPGLTWDEALEAFLQSRQLGINGAQQAVKPRTLVEYRWDLGAFFDFVKGLRLNHYNQLTEKIIQGYVGYLQSPARGKKGGWSKATQRKYLISLKAFFRWVELDSTCQDAGMQPFLKSLPRIGKAVRREFIPSQEQMDIFRDGFDKDVTWGMRDWTVVTLMLDTGARIGEICNLEPDDFYWDVSMVNLDGKTGKRLVPFDPDITGRAIKHWLNWRKDYVHEGCKKVFISRYGGTCIPNTFSQSFSDNLRKTGLDKVLGDNTISAHTIRHFFCTMFLVHGGTLHTLQKITGHKSLDTLMIYVHLANQMTTVQSEHNRVSPLKFMSGKTEEKKKRNTVRL